ncbi:SWIM zinc finger family protein [Thomasclavelia sp.]
MKNWENRFNKNILKQGKKYYSDGYVQKINKTCYGYLGIVNDHEVEIYTSNFIDINEMYCSCSKYDQNSYCKHLAALLYAIDELSGNEEIVNENEIEKVIDQLSEKQLKDYLKKVMKSTSLIEDFKFEFIDSFQEVGLKKDVISFYRRYQSVAYDLYYEEDFDVYDFCEDVEGYVNKIKKLIHAGKLNEALSCIFAAIVGLQRTEIEDGFIYDMFDLHYNLLSDIVDCGDKQINKSIYHWVMSQINYVDWDAFLDILWHFYNQNDYQDIVLRYIDEELNMGNNKPSYLKIKYHSLNGEDLKTFIDRYYNIKIIRELYLKDLLQDNKYIEAIQVLNDNEKYADCFFDYKKNSQQIIDLCKKIGLIDEAINEVIKFLLKTRDLEVFCELKRLYGDRWLEHRDKIFSLMKNEKIDIEKFYEEEMMVDELYEEVKDDFCSLYHYRWCLKDKYLEQITKSTVDYVFNEIEANRGTRKRYQYLAKYILELRKLGNDYDIIIDTFNKIIDKYPTRKVLIEEMQKIL